ncbi:MAG: hypothetical protein JW763_07790 [candidate division Zixibacteria bacterium]|nr:hypothetical protein [candidate division Zixibacteria bacterium]
MSLFTRFFKPQESVIFPCRKIGKCPFEYDQNSDRDIEGMPIINNDNRSCPVYGHICPRFMEDFGLTVEDLRIRAIIHCGEHIDDAIAQGEVSLDDPAVQALKMKYDQTIRQYPRDRYLKYY